MNRRALIEILRHERELDRWGFKEIRRREEEIRNFTRGLDWEFYGLLNSGAVDTPQLTVTSDAELLRSERKQESWTVKEQAHRMGLHASDFYKAVKRTLPPGSAKQNRLDAHVKLLRKSKSRRPS